MKRRLVFSIFFFLAFSLGGFSSVNAADLTISDIITTNGNWTLNGIMNATSFTGDGTGLDNVTASALSCSSCITASQLNFMPVTSMTAGTGLSGGTITSTGTISVDFSGSNGTATTVARSDHNHNNEYQRYNPLQVALLRWYGANQTGISYPVGTGPDGIAFDGANMWITNSGAFNPGPPSGSTVKKVRASDGAVLDTFNVGNVPVAVAFDGANIWVVNYGSNNVTKLKASDGTLVDTYPVGNNPTAIAFDGTNVWITNNDGDTGQSVTVRKASDGTLVNTYSYTGGTGPYGIAFDGTNMWIANGGGVPSVTVLRASDGNFVADYPLPGTCPNDAAFDGTNIWVTDWCGGNADKLRTSDGSVIGVFSVGTNPSRIAFDGMNMWVTNGGGGTVTKLRWTDGALQGTYTVGSAPSGIAFDGANIWVTNNGSGTASKL